MSKKLCPKCGSEKIIPILYGYPTKEMFEDSDNDECILGYNISIEFRFMGN